MKKLTARLTYEQYDAYGNVLDTIRKNFYGDDESFIQNFVCGMYFFARRCMADCGDIWDKYFWLPGDENVKMILDTSRGTTKEHLDKAEARIKAARELLKVKNEL